MRISYRLSLLAGFVMVGSFCSCVSNKRITYFQDSGGEDSIEFGELVAYERSDYLLQYNDILDVSINTLESLLRDGFDLNARENNLPVNMGAMQGDLNYLTGYRVGKDGTIDLPILGKVAVSGLTLAEAKAAIEEKLKKFVTSEVFVQVRLGGILFSALGEFKRPGKYVLLQERLTIFEAVAAAGDLNNLANRGELILLRQFPDGSRMYRIDLNDRNIIRSPYYFIQSSDLIYAEPMKVRELGAGENAAQSLSLLISSISALALILTLTTR
jgi:polysaccharide export outer membrane protein